MAHFQIPMDLPHAGTIAWRIQRLLQPDGESPGIAARRACAIVTQLREILDPFRLTGDGPPPEEEAAIAASVAALGRRLVEAIEARGLGGDRLGQCVRNLFECLELGEEGAAISLRAGENPASAQRPV